MPETDPFKVYIDARARIRDAAKWIVTILGSTIVLIIGGGLIANIPSLDSGHIVAAGVCLCLLSLLCVVPLVAAIGILVSPFASFDTIATSDDYRTIRATVNKHLETVSMMKIEELGPARQKAREALAEAVSGDATTTAAKKVDELEFQIREIIELVSVRFLEDRFKEFLALVKKCAAGIAIVLVAFLVALHKDTPAERMLARPTLMSIASSEETHSVLLRAGLDQTCYFAHELTFVRVADIADRGAVLLVVPNEPAVGNCQPVRVILTNAGRIEVVD